MRGDSILHIIRVYGLLEPYFHLVGFSENQRGIICSFAWDLATEVSQLIKSWHKLPRARNGLRQRVLNNTAKGFAIEIEIGTTCYDLLSHAFQLRDLSISQFDQGKYTCIAND